MSISQKTVQSIEHHLARIAEECGRVPRVESMEGSNGWTVYLPRQVPCICDTFDDAAAMMREYLKRRRAP